MSTIQEQAQALEESYSRFHRMTTQHWRTDEDRRDALETLKQQAEAADQILRLPATHETTHARSKLMLWREMAIGTLKEMEPR
jgi:hypothetical protein